MVADPGLINMWSLRNIALAMSYAALGFAMTFTTTPLTVYCVIGLGVSSDKVNVLTTFVVGGLAWPGLLRETDTQPTPHGVSRRSSNRSGVMVVQSVDVTCVTTFE